LSDLEEGCRLDIQLIQGTHFLLLAGNLPTPIVYDPTAEDPTNVLSYMDLNQSNECIKGPGKDVKGCRSIAIGEEILIFGGMDDRAYHPVDWSIYFWKYTEFGGWRRGQMPVKRENFGIAYDGSDYVFLIGGVGGVASTRVDKYHVKTGEFSRAPDLSSKRQWCGATAFNGSIYVTGGYNPTYNTSEVLEPGATEWRVFDSMGSRRGGIDILSPVEGGLLTPTLILTLTLIGEVMAS